MGIVKAEVLEVSEVVKVPDVAHAVTYTHQVDAGVPLGVLTLAGYRPIQSLVLAPLVLVHEPVI